IRASASPPPSERIRSTHDIVLRCPVSKLQLVLKLEHGELVGAFVREASLAEAVPAPAASLIADDAVEAWQALCLPDSARQRAGIELLSPRRDVRARILLQGHSRFSHVVASLAGRVRRDAGVSCQQNGQFRIPPSLQSIRAKSGKG